MTCDVEYLRLTDGHGWTHKPAPSDKEAYHKRPRPFDFDPNLPMAVNASKHWTSIKQICMWTNEVRGDGKTLGQIAYELYCQILNYTKLAAQLGYIVNTTRNMVAAYARTRGLSVPKPVITRSEISRQVYDEYMAGARMIDLCKKYNRPSPKALRNNIYRYAKLHKLPTKKSA